MDKKFKNGLVLGKFFPFTLGHKYLIDSAIKQCETVHVMVCSLKREYINGVDRVTWVRNTYKNQPNINIIHCDDENPQYPNECASLDEFYNKYWVPTVYKNIKELDIVFTSEDYGEEFARYLGIKHVMVDKERKTVPVSGTAVRTRPFDNWTFIDKDVQRFFMKKVAILGPESTGKSTLTLNLANHFKSNFIGEYGREYTEKIGTGALTITDFENIAIEHDRRLKEIEPTKVIFSDTDAIITKTFGQMYLEEFESDKIDEVIKNQIFDLYLVLDTDVPWIDDGTRDFPHRRGEHLSLIIHELDFRGIKYVIIDGNYEERFQKAIKEVEKLGYL
jgi:HTH-type transcriptional repressor of NAD biosynthesis genes